MRNLLQNAAFWWVLFNCACAAGAMHCILQSRAEKSLQHRQFAGWVLLTGLWSAVYVSFSWQNGAGFWGAVLGLNILGLCFLSSLYDEQKMMWISTGLVLVIFHQLGTLLMRMTGWFCFGQDLPHLAAGWRIFALTLYGVILAGLEFSLAFFRKRKLSLGRRYYVRTETETIVAIFYLLFLCGCVLVCSQPVDEWCWNALLEVLPLTGLYFIFSFLYTRREQKQALEEASHLKGIIARQRQEAFLAREQQHELSAIRHDYRNIFLTAEQMLAENRTDETLRLLMDYRQRLLQAAPGSREEPALPARKETDHLPEPSGLQAGKEELPC